MFHIPQGNAVQDNARRDRTTRGYRLLRGRASCTSKRGAPTRQDLVVSPTENGSSSNSVIGGIGRSGKKNGWTGGR